MGDASTKQIEILAFSPAFENMCNFVAIAKIGDPSETIRGLIKLCLLELPGEKFEEAQDFHKVIEVLFGLTVSISQIETALSELQKKYIIKRTGNTNFQLEHNVSLALREAIQHSQIIENTVKLAWFNEITDQYPDLPTDIAWQLLRDYLCRIFRRHGIQAAALLDPTIDTPTEYVSSLSLILQQVIKDNKIDDKQIQKTAEKAISGFMADLGSNSNRAIYITQLADGAFNYYTLGIPTDLSKLLRQNLEAITLFLDTNFLFGILDLHYNTQVQVSHDLLRSISEHKLPFKLCYHVATQREMNNTIGYYSSMLRPYDWSISLSRAAIMSLNISGIEQKFHQLNAQGLVDVDEFLRPYEHLDYMLKEKKIKVFRPIEDRISARTDLYHDYQLFLENNNRGDKTYETIMHDAILLEEARHLRSDAASSLQAGALIISCDYLLYRFDWESSRKSGQRACVLLPNIFWQIIRPFIPTDQDFEKAFAETFALPEFRAMNSGGSKACSKMLQILASYKDVPEQTAIKLLTNDILLDKLRVECDDARFNQQVEAAFVEVNRDLIEEKALSIQLQFPQETSFVERYYFDYWILHPLQTI